MSKEIVMHYNAFETIKEQIEKQGLKLKDIEHYEQEKFCIIYLYLHNILTESEKDKCIKRLHKEIVKKVEE